MIILELPVKKLKSSGSSARFCFLLWALHLFEETYAVPVNFPSNYGNDQHFANHIPPVYLRASGPNQHNPNRQMHDHSQNQNSFPDKDDMGRINSNQRRRNAKLPPVFERPGMDSESWNKFHHGKFEEPRNFNKNLKSGRDLNGNQRNRRFNQEMNFPPPKPPRSKGNNNLHYHEEDRFYKSQEKTNKYRHQPDTLFREGTIHGQSFNPQGFYYEDPASSQRFNDRGQQNRPRQPQQKPFDPHTGRSSSVNFFQPNQDPHWQHKPTAVLIQGPGGNLTMFIEYDISDNDITYETTVEVEDTGNEVQEQDL